jgi:lia operon protein LiaG
MNALCIAALLLWSDAPGGPVARAAPVLAAAPATPAAPAAQQPERRTLSGDHVAVYNLAGVMRLERGTGPDVVVELSRGGPDAAKLTIVTGALRGRETLRVIYPDDDLIYRELGHRSSTTLHVRDDGTFNDQEGRKGHWSEEGRRVRISGSGGGLEAHADVRVAVPTGKRVEVYLAVGQAFVTNVDGDFRVDVTSANVAADHVKGSLLVATGSGDVRLSDAEGDVSLDTGSGDVTVTDAHGRVLRLGTGSGNVTADRVTADALKIDTGSGNVTATVVRSNDVRIDTGSGDVRLDLKSNLESLYVDTGSGDVTVNMPAELGAEVDLDTGSGEIDLQNVTVRTTRLEKDHVRGAIGDGKGRMHIETGSGGIRLARSR